MRFLLLGVKIPSALTDVGMGQFTTTYLLLTEFEVRTVSYGPSFFLIRFMAQARSARAINQRGKNEDP